MSGGEISVRCSHCGVRLKCSGNRSRIKCPKCQQYSEIQASAVFGTIPSSVVTPPASLPARIPQPVVTVETKTAPFAESDSDHTGKLRILLSNGLAQGVLAAAVLYVVLPELGLTGSRLILVLAGVVAAGYFGLLHKFYRLAMVFSGQAYSTTSADSSVSGTGTSLPVGARPKPESARDDDSAENVGGKQRLGKLTALFVCIVLPLAGAIVFSMLKPVLGIAGISMVLAGVAAAFVLYLVVLHLAAAAVDGTRTQAKEEARARARWSMRTGLVAIGLFACYVGAESTGPPEGLVRLIAARTVARMSESPELPGDDAWSKASLVLAHPGHFAVALRNEGSDGGAPYRVLAKASDRDTIRALRIAWDLRNPVIGNDPALAKRVYADAQVNRLMDGNLSLAVANLLKPREWIPAESTLFSFIDARSGKNRVGHLLRQGPQGFEFADLLPAAVDSRRAEKQGGLPFRSEVISRQRDIRPGTERVDLNDAMLRENADFLDYCLYHVIQKLQNNQNRPAFVFVNPVAADIDQREVGIESLKMAREGATGLLDEELRGAFDRNVSHAQLLDFLVTRLAETEKEREREQYRDERRRERHDDVTAIRRQIARIRTVLDQENRLTSEIRTRLSRSGVPLVERSNSARDVLRGLMSGKNFVRPTFAEQQGAARSGQSSKGGGSLASANPSLPGMQDEDEFQQLVAASHVLMTDLRTSEKTGRYQLSMRLVDLTTGMILWEDQGDRTISGEVPLAQSGGASDIKTSDDPTGAASANDIAGGAGSGSDPARNTRASGQQGRAGGGGWGFGMGVVSNPAPPAPGPMDEIAGTWEHHVTGTMSKRKINQTLTIVLFATGRINDPNSTDYWSLDGSTLQMTVRGGNGLITYNAVLSADKKSYSGKLGTLVFDGKKMAP